MKTYWGSGGIAPRILDLGTKWGEWSASRPGCFTPRERSSGTHWIGGWVGPSAVLDAVVKRKIPSPRRESNPRTPIVQSVAQRYTDWAINGSVGDYEDNINQFKHCIYKIIKILFFEHDILKVTSTLAQTLL
jgi:hypothetical protein